MGPVNNNPSDLLAGWKLASGMKLDVIDYTIWRIHIKVSISIHLTAASYSSDTGYAIGLFVDSLNQPTFPVAFPFANQYDERFLIWDTLFLNEVVAQSPFAVTTTLNTYALYKEYDIKSHRKLNENDTLWFYANSRGNAQADEFDVLHRTLLRHR